MKNILIFACTVFAFQSLAQSPKATVKSGAKHIKMLSAFSQRTMPGARGMKPITDYHFILVWKNNDAPGTFVWRGDHTWMTCSLLKVHKANKKNADHTSPAGFSYTLEDVTKHPLKKGDTLEISPLAGGKFAVPKEIPQDSMNVLYFKTVKSEWLSYPVKKITAMQDIVLP